jgi:MYXO-CTERM domain-containing protein
MAKANAPTRTALVACVLGALVGCGRPALQPLEDDVVPAATVDVDAVRGWHRDGDFLVSPVLSVPLGATRVAAIVRTTPGATVAVEAAGISDDILTFVPMLETWRDPVLFDRAVVRADLPTRADAVVVRVRAADVEHLKSLTFEAVVPLPERPADLVAPPTPHAFALLEGYAPRSAWGARAARGCDANVSKSKVTVHHTVSRLHEGGTRDQFSAEIRAAQSLHMDGRGYCDIGYHFLVSADGTVWEGRNASQLGAHTGSQNSNNLGISFVGCFHPTSDCNGLGSTTPPQAMLDGAGAFIGTAARHYGINLVVGSTLLGHRDNAGQSTACPGNSLHARLGELRTIATGTSTPTPPPTTTGTVQGMVWNLAITEDASAATTLQAKLPGARIVATRDGVEVGISDARATDAYWSFDLPAGSYRLTATLTGFAPATRDVVVAAGGDGWASIGLRPQDQSVAVGVTVVDAVTLAPLTGATVQFGADAPVAVDAVGLASASVAAGEIVIVARAEGYGPLSESHTVVLGDPLALTFALDATTGEEPDPADPADPADPGEVPPPPSGGLERITIRNAPTAGGCGCRTTGADPVAGLGVLLLGLWRRRGRRRNAH